MNSKNRLRLGLLTALAPLSLAHAAQSDDIIELAPITVQAESLPSEPVSQSTTSENISAEQIATSVNAATTAETVKYLPSVVVRERYIGDRNGILATRTSGTLSSAATLVYADGIQLSNLLGNSYAYPPRWGMVSPESVEQVDMLYGPFSALYAGNSEGGVVLLKTRLPDKFEAHASVQLIHQPFSLYGTRQNYGGNHTSASIGNRSGAWSYWFGADHLDTVGQPMSFSTAAQSSTAGGSNPVVTGAYYDTDQNGNRRVVFGGYSIDHSVQDNARAKLAYDITPTLRATYTLGLWQATSDTRVDSYLRDAAGNTFYNGTVSLDGNKYTVAGLSPGHSESEHLMQGLSLRSDTRGSWDWEALFSRYDYTRDISRTAYNSGTHSGLDGTLTAGQLTDMQGTGWNTLDLRGVWRPGGTTASAHRVSLGYHRDQYRLSSVSYSTSDWLAGSPGSVTGSSFGTTRTQALYLEDAWKFAPRWKLTYGGRGEYWQALDGSNSTATATQHYADRSRTTFSPKLSLAWQNTPVSLVRASLGKAYRFPTVTELYQAIRGTSSNLQNNPDLQPEQVLSAELTYERAVNKGMWRVSLFQENKRDALYSQTDTTVTPTLTSIQNIERIRTQGVETAFDMKDVGLNGLDLRGSLTYTRSIIVSDTQNPAYQGTWQPRLPDWRATLLTTWRASGDLSYSLGLRYSGRQHVSLGTADVNPDTYGGASSYLIADARVVYRLDKQWRVTGGIDNLGNAKAYVFHPWPQRTFFASLNYDY